MTAFSTPYNLYKFGCVSHGLVIGAQVLIHLIDNIFTIVKYKFLFNYLDDLVIYSSNFSVHLDHMLEVFLPR